MTRADLWKAIGGVGTVSAISGWLARNAPLWWAKHEEKAKAAGAGEEQRRLDDTRSGREFIASELLSVRALRAQLDALVNEKLAALAEENKELRGRVEALEAQVERLRGVDEENARLRDDLARLKGAA